MFFRGVTPIDITVPCGENPKKEPDNSCSVAGNPINFVYGFKVEKELDYVAGGMLQFERIYRSNGSWLEFNLGKYWRHNYDRSLQVVNTTEADSTLITTAQGTAYLFRSDADVNDWEALDSDVHSTFTERFDVTPTLTGYLYTTESDTKEY